MKLETYLNVMIAARDRSSWLSEMDPKWLKRNRQYRAFRDRILKMDKMARSIIDDLNMEIQMRDASIEKHLQNNSALTKRIAELEGYLKALHHDEL